MNYRFDVFISYSRKDSEQVLPIVKKLQETGFTIWIDTNGVESGDAFKTVIVQAIKNSYIFLFFSSKDSNESLWTVKEVNTAVYLKKTIIPIKLDNADYADSILFDLVGLDFVDLSVEEKREAALNKLINTLLGKISSLEVENPIQKSNKVSLSKKDGFEFGYDLAVFSIHKLRGQTSERDDNVIAQRLTALDVNPEILLQKLNAETMVLNLSNCAVRLGKLQGKDLENCVCLGSLFVFSVIAKRSKISEEFGHSYDEGIVVACRKLGIPKRIVEKLIKSSDDEMEEMLEELKGLLDILGNEHSVGDVLMLGNQKGIVFYLDESHRHGKIVSVDCGIKQWCTRNEYLVHRDTKSVSDDDGMANLKRIQLIPDWDLLYPAFKWCAKKGDVWYLPTIEDYRMINKQRDAVFEKINGIDEKKWFWSSEQESVYSARYYHFLTGQAHGVGKDNECSVLAVAEF